MKALQSVTSEEIDIENRSAGQNVSESVDYRLNARDVLSNALSFNRRSSGDASTNPFAELNSSGGLVESYFRPKNASAKGWMYDYDAVLKRFKARRPRRFMRRWLSRWFGSLEIRELLA